MPFITVQKRGSAGLIGLNRPKAMNALTLDMITEIDAALDAFEADDSVDKVILWSHTPGVFSAGGDMRRIRELILAESFEEAETFFRTEYTLNLRIASYPKPYISLIDGICMGGGMGLSMHGKFRIASERAIFAMPETAIGFVPDVGGSFFLPRMSHYSGYWMGLTGARLNGFDAHALGLSTHMTISDSMALVMDELCHSPILGDTIRSAHFSSLTYQTSILSLASFTMCFSRPSLSSIQTCLAASHHEESEKAQKALRSVSPHSLNNTLSLLQLGARSSLKVSLEREFGLAKQAIRHPDFAEGVRAVLIDKDHKPNWQSPAIAAPKQGCFD